MSLTTYSTVKAGEFFVPADKGCSPLYRKREDGACDQWSFNFAASSSVGLCIQKTDQPKEDQPVVVLDEKAFKWSG